MFTVKWIDSMGTGFRQFHSVEEIRSWAKFNGRVLGVAALYMPTYEVTISETGAALSEDVLRQIQPLSSAETYDREQRETLRKISAVDVPVPSMYDGAATAAILRSGLLVKRT